MGFVVLTTWFAPVLQGPFMPAVWLIENDVTDRALRPAGGRRLGPSYAQPHTDHPICTIDRVMHPNR